MEGRGEVGLIFPAASFSSLPTPRFLPEAGWGQCQNAPVNEHF